ncbi:MAG: trypsin-like serine protease [Pseudomonadota bacterium]
MTRSPAMGLGAVLAIAAAVLSAVPSMALDLDRRRMLTTQEHVPWKGVGRVNVAARSEQSMCTGTLIDADLVITAAHCVYSNRTGLRHAPGNIHFVAGWRRGTKVAHRLATEVIVHPGYLHGTGVTLDQIGVDVALIRLESPIPQDVVPAFPISGAASRGSDLTLISYRQDRAHALTRQDGCDIKGTDDRVFVLGCDVTFGASGSPLFAEIDGRPRIVAVISAKGQDRTTREELAFAVSVAGSLPALFEQMGQ